MDLIGRPEFEMCSDWLVFLIVQISSRRVILDQKDVLNVGNVMVLVDAFITRYSLSYGILLQFYTYTRT